ncbi:MAG TPA: 50S ribosomal protein L15 [Elusimicrobiota bacterium]|nr:50S ribosomal protein L15 [Elusimicrobiota bacterium]
MRLDELKPAPGSRHRRKIVGRGIGSGHGAQSTRGMKGQRSRSGFSGMAGFEGGQIPLIRRIPKRGFRHTAFMLDYAIVNVSDLESRFEAKASVSPKSLQEHGLAKSSTRVKILGGGEITKPLTVQAHGISASAKAKIEMAGGTVEILKK